MRNRTIILVTIDFHGYADCYQRALIALGYDVRTFIGMRSFHWPSRIRNAAAISVPNALGAHRDRTALERARLSRFLDRETGDGRPVLFVNAQVLVTDDLLERISDSGGASALWLLDGLGVHPTHNLHWNRFDLVATFNRSDLGQLQVETDHCMYLPQGFDSLLTVEGSLKSFNPVLIGAPSERRIAVVREILRRRIDVELVGRYWPKYIEAHRGLSIVAHDVDLADACSRYGNGRTCLNAHSRVDRGINPRSFEVPGAGGLLVTDNPQITTMFDPATELLYWQEPSEAGELVERAQRDPVWAQEVARRGKERAFAEHTLVHRFRALLDEWTP